MVPLAAQFERARAEAARLENELYATQVGEALGMNKTTSVTTTRLHLARARARAGATADPVEQTLLNNLSLANLKVAEIFALATSTEDVAFAQRFLNAANRLLHSVCELTTTLARYRKSQESGAFEPEFPDGPQRKEKRKKGRRDGK